MEGVDEGSVLLAVFLLWVRAEDAAEADGREGEVAAGEGSEVG